MQKELGFFNDVFRVRMEKRPIFEGIDVFRVFYVVRNVIGRFLIALGFLLPGSDDPSCFSSNRCLMVDFGVLGSEDTTTKCSHEWTGAIIPSLMHRIPSELRS